MLKSLHRSDLPKRPVKVLQFGEGNFLRAFADWIIDILNEQTDFNGAVTIVQPLPLGMGDAINKQDGLYHVLLNGIHNGATVKESRLITSVEKVINPYQDFEGFKKEAENPELKFIISNTTESGIAFSEKDKSIEVLPDSFPGKLTSLLYHRFKFFKGSQESGLIFLPCELIEKNGDQLKAIILQYAGYWNLPTAFSEWILNKNIFCNTLVDRIVPGFPADSIKEIQQELGFEDNLVVKAEPFHLWVIEGPAIVSDLFPVKQTSLEVIFVNDLTPYRTRKVRILNGAHTAMVPVAYLKGLRTVQETVEHEKTGAFVKYIVFNEIIPTLDLPLSELESFANSVIERFRNPFIRHELISIALNSVSKYKVRVLPSVLEYYKRKGELPASLIKALAHLICFYKGEYSGESIPVKDSAEVMKIFNTAWSRNSIEVTVKEILSDTALWEVDLTLVGNLYDMVLDEVKQKTKMSYTPL